MKATAANSARTKRYFNNSPPKITRRLLRDRLRRFYFGAASARAGRGVLLLFELRAEARQLRVRGVDLPKLAEPRLGLLQVARLDERQGDALQGGLVLRVGLERLPVLAYRASGVGRLGVEVRKPEARVDDNVVGLRLERRLVERARVGERHGVAVVAARDKEENIARHDGRLVVLRVELVRALEYARNVGEYLVVACLPRVEVKSLPDILLKFSVGRARVRLRDRVLQLLDREFPEVALARRALRAGLSLRARGRAVAARVRLRAA